MLSGALFWAIQHEWGSSKWEYMLCAVLSCFSPVWLFETPWTVVAHQAPLSVGFSRQEHWSGLPYPSLGDLPDPGMRPNCPEVKIVEARWWLRMIHYSIFSTFVYAYNFPNEEPFKSIPKFWIYTKSRVFLQWGCFPIRGPFPFRCVCPDHPESSSFLWGPSPQCGHQNSTSSETAQQFHPPNCLTQRGIES